VTQDAGLEFKLQKKQKLKKKKMYFVGKERFPNG
jgi:hypothetical protein